MSDVNNKDFIAKSKKIMDNLGVEIKVAQLYEFFSQLANEKNWNIAKVKKVQFRSLIEKTSQNDLKSELLKKISK